MILIENDRDIANVSSENSDMKKFISDLIHRKFQSFSSKIKEKERKAREAKKLIDAIEREREKHHNVRKLELDNKHREHKAEIDKLHKHYIKLLNDKNTELESYKKQSETEVSNLRKDYDKYLSDTHKYYKKKIDKYSKHIDSLSKDRDRVASELEQHKAQQTDNGISNVVTTLSNLGITSSDYVVDSMDNKPLIFKMPSDEINRLKGVLYKFGSRLTNCRNPQSSIDKSICFNIYKDIESNFSSYITPDALRRLQASIQG